MGFWFAVCRKWAYLNTKRHFSQTSWVKLEFRFNLPILQFRQSKGHVPASGSYQLGWRSPGCWRPAAAGRGCWMTGSQGWAWWPRCGDTAWCPQCYRPETEAGRRRCTDETQGEGEGEGEGEATATETGKKKWENLLDAVRKKRNKKRVEMRLTLEMSLMTFINSAVAAAELFQQPYFHFFYITVLFLYD